MPPGHTIMFSDEQEHLICNKYIIERKTVKEISNIFNCSSYPIIRILSKNNMPRRNKHEASKGRLKTEAHKRNISLAHKGKKMPPCTEETRKIRSINASGSKSHFFGKPPYKGAGLGKGSYYQSPLQGEVYLRSSYELEYAKYLDTHGVLWMYEIESFNLSDDMTYIPDFFLPQQEMFIEIKGWMKPKSQVKINKFKEEYPFDLTILNRNDLLTLGLKIR